MKPKLQQFLLLLVLLLPLAVTANGQYTRPSTTAPNGNTGGPITIGTEDQVKEGSLYVGTFNAKGDAQLGNPQCSDKIDNNGNGQIDKADPGCHSDSNANNANSYTPYDFTEALGAHATVPSTTFTQIIRGENDFDAPTGDKPLTFGDATNVVTIAAGGNISASSVVQSNTLKNGATNKLCGDQFGVFIFCPPTAPVRLNIGLTFNQPSNSSYSISIALRNIRTEGIVNLSNSGNTSTTPYYQSVDNVSEGVYEITDINVSCPFVSYGYDVAVGTQYIVDKKHNTQGFTVACAVANFDSNYSCNDGRDNDGDGTADHRNGVVVNGRPLLQDPQCGGSMYGGE